MNKEHRDSKRTEQRRLPPGFCVVKKPTVKLQNDEQMHIGAGCHSLTEALKPVRLTLTFTATHRLLFGGVVNANRI